MNIEEGAFWREIVFGICNHYQLEPEVFFKKISPLKEVWEIENPEIHIERIEKMQRDKSRFIENEISTIIKDIR